MDCGVCQFDLQGPPFGEQEKGSPVPVVTDCGHIYHNFCLDHSLINSNTCPDCRENVDPLGVRRIYLPNSNQSQEIEELQRKLSDQLKLNEDLKKNIGNLKEKLAETRIRGFGSRIHDNKEFDDSTCFNCESKEHSSRDCKNPPLLRSTENIEYSKWIGLVDPDKKFLSVCEFGWEKAGIIISYFEDELKMKFTRKEIRCVFAFVFFDKVCWFCGSPFHENWQCPCDPDPGIKKVCKLMHLQNHPLTEEEVKKRYERRQIFEAN